MKLENIRAIVTGAASGIGRCIALELARVGAIEVFQTRSVPEGDSAAQRRPSGYRQPLVFLSHLSCFSKINVFYP